MCIIFNLRMRLHGCLLCRKWKVKKREERGRLASPRRHLGRAQTLPDGISGGHVYETEWLHQPNTVCCLKHTHGSQPNISIMKCPVIYVSSDSAGPENKRLVSCVDLCIDHQVSNTGTDTTPSLLTLQPFSYLPLMPKKK